MCGTPAADLPAGVAPLKGRTTAPVTSPGLPEPANPRANLPIVVGGVVVLAIAAAFLIPRMGADEPVVATMPQASGGPAGDPSAVDLSSMSPEEAAVRLMNRVMTSVSSGDSAQARAFAPMAISVYGMVPQLTLDDRYHLAQLHLVNDDAASAMAQADTILAESPSHLFGLATAAESSRRSGNASDAREFYQRFLDSYDAESAAGRPEYTEHATLLPILRDAATLYVDGGAD